MSAFLKYRRVVFIFSFAVVAVLVAVLFLANPPKETKLPTTFVPATWNAARMVPMHEAHVGREKIACTKCHADGFAESPGTKGCASCHEAESKRMHVGSATGDESKGATTCLTCHAFAGNAAAEKACTKCHVAGTPDGGAVLTTGKMHGLAAHASEKSTCNACHATHGEPRMRVDVRADCTRCHDVRARHGDLRAAPRDAGPDAEPSDAAALLAFVDGGPDASATIQMCTACHAPHTDKAAARATCAGCHQGKAAKPHEACVTCHAQHDATMGTVKSCTSCHGGKRPSEGHVACTSCHSPHSPARASSNCAGCHKGVSALASTRVPEHSACVSCHEPHARPGEATRAPSLACVKCHADVHPSHPSQKDSAGIGCTSCHAPHPKAPARIAAACSSCHTKARDDQAFHVAGPAGPTCNGCHRPHAFALSGAAAGPALCGQCHGAKVATARSGHAACANCHGPTHTPTAKPGSCRACHAAEATTASAGHANCTSCHDAHTGSLAKVGAGAGAGGGASCASCHAAKAKALHGNVGVGGGGAGCATCHRAHGPTGVAQPPACATCHAPAKLPGLHSVGAHAAKCASCHTTHAPPHADRATCTTGCHVQKRGHQPEAAVCTGCHVFRR